MGLLEAIRGVFSPPMLPPVGSRRTLRDGRMPDWNLGHDRMHEFSSGEAPLPWRTECRVRLWRDLSGLCPPVVVLTDQSRGARVADRVEAIASEVSARLALPAEAIWIAHIPAGGSGGERYQVVTFPPPRDADVRDLSGPERSWIKVLEAGTTREEK